MLSLNVIYSVQFCGLPFILQMLSTISTENVFLAWFSFGKPSTSGKALLEEVNYLNNSVLFSLNTLF